MAMDRSNKEFFHVQRASTLSCFICHIAGIILTHNSHMRITPANLSFVTNADDPSLEIRYDVTTVPQHGAVQRLRPEEGGDGVWQAVETFTSLQVARGQVRYLHVSGTPAQDSFQVTDLM